MTSSVEPLSLSDADSDDVITSPKQLSPVEHYNCSTMKSDDSGIVIGKTMTSQLVVLNL